MALSLSAEERVSIRQPADVQRAQRLARKVARALSFDEHASEEAVLAVSELARNLLRHATDGEIVVTPVQVGERTGIKIESLDRGPGIEDIDRALTDGFSTKGGLGSGLPAVRRLTDEFDIASDPSGTHIRAYKWFKKSS